MKKFHQYVV